MGTIIHGLCLLLGGRGNTELLRQIDYLKIENQILRRKLPSRIALTPAERRRLIRFGRPLGKALHDLISIVSPRTFARWLEAAPAAAAPKRGRPPVGEDIRKLVIRLAEENAWGYTRILGELRKLGVKHVSRSTVVNILRREGLDPGPKRGRGTWHDFIRRHKDTLWACDFFTKRICTMTGVVDCMVLFFIHLGSRRVHLAGLTTHPDRAWMAEKAREVRFLRPTATPAALPDPRPRRQILGGIRPDHGGGCRQSGPRRPRRPQPQRPRRTFRPHGQAGMPGPFHHLR